MRRWSRDHSGCRRGKEPERERREREKRGQSRAGEQKDREGRELGQASPAETTASSSDDSISTKVDWLFCDPRAGSPRMAHGQEPTESGLKGTRVRVHNTSRDVATRPKRQTGRVQGHYIPSFWLEVWHKRGVWLLKASRILSSSFKPGKEKEEIVVSRVGRSVHK